MRLPRRRRPEIQRTINGIRQEQPAEKHDFRDEEHPHAEVTRLKLLRHVIEMVLRRRMRVACSTRAAQG